MNKQGFWVAFCCEGNTCRSKMAETVFTKKAQAQGVPYATQSFGLRATEGETNETALLALRQAGYPAAPTATTPVTAVNLTAPRVILCMESAQKAALSPFIGAETALYAAKDLIGRDIPDPLGKSLIYYEETLTEIEALIDALLNKIQTEGKPSKKERI